MENEISINSPSLDNVDMAIIEALRQDGRTSFAQIAEQQGVSAGMIRLRYNRLVEAGLLKIVAITNPLGLGYTTMAVIGIRADGHRLMEVAEKVAALEEVIYLIVVSGRYDIIAEVMCRDREHLLQFLTERLYKVEGVRESETFMHLRIVKEIYF